MHSKCYVLVPVSAAKTSLDARKYVVEELGSDSSFVGEGGRFASPICDYFVIGGGWSGELNPRTLLDDFWKQAKQLQQPSDCSGSSQSFNQEKRKQLDTIWQKMGGKYTSPLNRDQYSDLGEDDDACILEDWLAKELNEYLNSSYDCYVDHVSIINQKWEMPIVISLDSDLFYTLKSFDEVIGKYWVVIIDYH